MMMNAVQLNLITIDAKIWGRSQLDINSMTSP